jgi:hypothetical protein
MANGLSELHCISLSRVQRENKPLSAAPMLGAHSAESSSWRFKIPVPAISQSQRNARHPTF